CASEDSLDVW
nr:immunoglobulin heavy chain junction region [Macaca mulatta]